MTTGENRFVFVAPMYNASKTLARMLHSVCGQSYDNWRVILIDDLSDMEESIRCSHIVKGFRALMGENVHSLSPDAGAPRFFGYDAPESRIELITNHEKKWEVANVLLGISMCEPNDIVCRLDADDWLTDLDALAIIDMLYARHGLDCLWTAHRWGFSDKNISGPLPAGADPYKHPWVSSHLKTFRKRLLDGVKDENFRGEDGQYVRRAGDQAVYLPVLYNAQARAYLPRVMYHYSIDDVPETYQTPDARFQRDEALFLRARGYVK